MAVDLAAGNRLELPWLAGKVVDLGRQLGRADAGKSYRVRCPETVRARCTKTMSPRIPVAARVEYRNGA